MFGNKDVDNETGAAFKPKPMRITYRPKIPVSCFIYGTSNSWFNAQLAHISANIGQCDCCYKSMSYSNLSQLLFPSFIGDVSPTDHSRTRSSNAE